jgi:hypothetical protein
LWRAPLRPARCSQPMWDPGFAGYAAPKSTALRSCALVPVAVLAWLRSRLMPRCPT